MTSVPFTLRPSQGSAFCPPVKASKPSSTKPIAEPSLSTNLAFKTNKLDDKLGLAHAEEEPLQSDIKEDKTMPDNTRVDGISRDSEGSSKETDDS